MNDIFNQIKFDEKGLVPAITQDSKSDEVLMLAYMNQEALMKSLETGKMHYYSRSRQKLWLKGETSGHFQYIKSVKVDCDEDTLLFKVEQVTAACHTGHYSCFYREIDGEWVRETKYKAFDPEKAENGHTDAVGAQILQEVYNVIADRLVNPKEGSYTNYLFNKGVDKILKKVGEETSEVIIAAKNKSKDETRYEIADLMYHLMVLMVERGISLDDIYEELKGRR